MRSPRFFGILVSLAAAVYLSDPRVLADAASFEIISNLQGTRIVTAVSNEGIITTHFANPSQPQQPSRRFLLRNADRLLWVVDDEHRSYFTTTLAAQLETTLAALRRVRTITLPDEVGRPVFPLALVAKTSMKSHIDGITIAAFEVTLPDQSWRIWIAPSLPRAAADIRAGLSQLIPADASSQKALAEMVGFPVVRAEMNAGTGWNKVLDTQNIRRSIMRSADFAAPAGFSVASRSIPSRPPGGMDVPAQAIRGPGPEMSNPELYVVHWGQALNDAKNQAARAALMGGIQDIVSDKYISWLRDYDIRSAKVSGVYTRPDLPPRAVGTSNFAAVSAMVYDVGFKEGAPIFWWSVGGHDPLYTILVSDDEVDSGGWTGYHFAAFSLTHAVLPFPASLFAHDAIPWLLAKIPAAGLSLAPEATLWREACAAVRAGRPVPPGTPANASFCATLDAFDEGTETISHEFVETASDPFVFFGWSDPTKQPFWKESEISDICEDFPLPWAETTVVGLTGVSTYWSNGARACVPESRPSVTVLEPINNSTVGSVDGRVVLKGIANDAADGNLSSQLQWSVDGVALAGRGDTMMSGILTAGYHAVEARVRNGASLEATGYTGFLLNPLPTKVTIISPEMDRNYFVGQHVVFRGQAFTYQPGDIPDSSLRWDDNGTPIGTGPLLFLPAPAAGDHTIRLSVGTAAQPSTSATVNIHTAQPGTRTRIPPSVIITAPTKNAFEVTQGSSKSGPILFTATALDANNAVPPGTLFWRSDLDGVLGTGPAITATLSGGSCAASIHKITVTITGPLGRRAADTIEVTVGQAC